MALLRYGQPRTHKPECSSTSRDDDALRAEVAQMLAAVGETLRDPTLAPVHERAMEALVRAGWSAETPASGASES